MTSPKLAVVIPALNEEKTVGAVIAKVMRHGVTIVVDDGSDDNTATISRDSGAIVVQHGSTLGYDSALNTGFKKAISLGCDVILTFDADGQHPDEIIDIYLSEIKKGADVVIGIRDRRARISEVLFSFISNKLWNIKDPLCGLKAYRQEVYHLLGHFDSYGSIGTELCIFAAQNKFKISQIPLKVHQRADNPRLGNIWRANWKIFRAMAKGMLKTVLLKNNKAKFNNINWKEN
jgi:glycosyltransferase involved in cell wall biosynthesis